jgi:hypothetical protein
MAYTASLHFLFFHIRKNVCALILPALFAGDCVLASALNLGRGLVGETPTSRKTRFTVASASLPQTLKKTPKPTINGAK